MFAIGLPGVFSLAGWAPLIHTEFLVFRATQDRGSATLVDFAYGTITLCGTSFHYVSAIDSRSPLSPVLLPRARHRYRRGLGSCAFARHYLRNHCYFLLLWVLRCFSSPRSLDGLNAAVPRSCRGGFPHSDIRGSMGICPSPRLFAAYHVLRRLREPQASPMRSFSLSLFLSP